MMNRRKADEKERKKTNHNFFILINNTFKNVSDTIEFNINKTVYIKTNETVLFSFFYALKFY